MAQRPEERDYNKEYRLYQGTPEQIANRSERNKARRLMLKKHGKDALEGKDVGHIKAMKRGGVTVMENLALQSVRQNRGWERKKGDLP
jgi:hypothetical protein